MAVLDTFAAHLRHMRQMIAASAMRKASVRPHAKLHIIAGKLTHTSQEAATAMQHMLTRKFHAMRTKVVTAINKEVNKAYSSASLIKMDVTSIDEFKRATKGKTRYSVNHMFDKPMQLRPRGKRPYGKKSEIYEATLELADLTPTQYWLKPEVVIQYFEQGENLTTKQTEDKPLHVVAPGNGDYLLSDGHHRAAMFRLKGEKEVDVTVFPRWASDREIAAAKKRYVKFDGVWQVGSLAKETDYTDIVDEIMKGLQDDFTSISSDAEAFLQQAALSGLSQGVIGIEVSDTALLSDVNTSAQEWAAERAAELVGMKWDGNQLVENPNPRWAITETTRDLIAEAVEDSFESAGSLADVAAIIDDSGVFDAARAEMIARTEISRAQIMGNVELWQQSGVVSEYNWLLGDENPCDECQELADGGPYVLGEGPLPIDDSHPNCNCVVAAVIAADEEE